MCKSNPDIDTKPAKEPEGYATARFKWWNFHGYGYEVVPIDEGSFEIRYFETDEADEPKLQMVFSESDADGLIEAISDAVRFFRNHDPSLEV